jgi:ABC-type antimicrobial peptide transport system permease subunit
MGVLALLLAAAGVYALMSFLVARRTHEIGVRGALGASRAALAGLVLRDAARLAGVGTGVGLALSVGVAAALRGLLGGVSPFAPAPFAVIALVLLCSALVAALVPARRAARVDPVAALRAE